jgi:hypothetical protein
MALYGCEECQKKEAEIKWLKAECASCCIAEFVCRISTENAALRKALKSHSFLKSPRWDADISGQNPPAMVG